VTVNKAAKKINRNESKGTTVIMVESF